MRLSSLFLTALLVQDAQATVIVHVPTEPLFTVREDGANIPIDIDGNGSTDFLFGGEVTRGSAFRTERANRYLATPATPPNLGGSVFPIQDNTVIRGAAPDGLAWLSTDLDGFVDPTDTGNFTLLALCVSTGCEGPFFAGAGPAIRGAIGVEFEAEDGIHFGYLDVEFTPFSLSGTIHGWAYEDEPNTAITAAQIPEPTLGGLFALASGVLLFGRRRHALPVTFKPSDLTP